MSNITSNSDASSQIQINWNMFHEGQDKNDRSLEAQNRRLSRMRDFLGFDVPHIISSTMTSAGLAGNIENFIGSVEVPIGLAGPLHFVGNHVHGPVVAPLATSEGALVASTCRGSKLLNACGGVHTTYLGSQMTRAPAFTCRTAAEALRLAAWVESHVSTLKALITEPHATLIRIVPIIHGRSLSLEFSYSTQDAAGQNMTTIATWECCRWIVENAGSADIQILRYSIEGGFSGDKKLSHRNFTQGRGSRVIAEAWIPEAQMQSIMRISTDDFVKSYLYDVPNYFLNGSVSCNANVANIIAALFTATGQDIACVPESSLAQMSIELDEGGMYASLLMPCLVVGTIGGGTRLPCQAEALKILGCHGPGTKERLAEIIAGYCLALEFSTMSAAVEGTFVKAHSQLGRQH